jgi:hypothetical protein
VFDVPSRPIADFMERIALAELADSIENKWTQEPADMVATRTLKNVRLPAQLCVIGSGDCATLNDIIPSIRGSNFVLSKRQRQF